MIVTLGRRRQEFQLHMGMLPPDLAQLTSDRDGSLPISVDDEGTPMHRYSGDLPD